MIKKIKQSISLKIVLILLMVSCLGLIASWIYARNIAQKSIIADYYNAVDVFSIMVENRMKDKLSDIEGTSEEMQQLADEMQQLCKKDTIEAIFIARITELDKERLATKGSILARVTADSISLEGVDGYFETFDAGEGIFEKHGDKANGFYYSWESNGRRFVSFVHMIDTIEAGASDNAEVSCGLVVPLDHFDSLVDELMLRLFAVMSGLIMFIIFVVGIVIQKSAVIPFITLSNSMKEFINDDNLNFEPLKVKGCDERAQVTKAFNTMAEEIKKHVESVKKYESAKQRVLANVAVAADIQKGLLPEASYIRKPFVVKGYLKAAKYIGGDIYYYERIGKDKIAFAIGDVSGKGVSAALFMSTAVGAIRYSFQQYESPAKALEQINIDMCLQNPNKLFVTLFVGILDMNNNTLTYSNAGHNPPFLLGDEIKVLSKAKGLLAGLFIDETYEDATITFEKNNQLFLYTDGVTEAVNEKKERFGEGRLKEILKSNHNGILEEVIESLKDFSGKADQYDDITIMTVGLMSDEVVLAAQRAAVPALKEFIMNNDKIPENLRKKVYLACEEIFVNIYSYGYPDADRGEVGIKVSADATDFCIRIADDGKEFNPLENQIDIDEYDIEQDVGGLGRYMAFNIMDDVEYRYENGKNVLVLKKKIES